MVSLQNPHDTWRGGLARLLPDLRGGQARFNLYSITREVRMWARSAPAEAWNTDNVRSLQDDLNAAYEVCGSKVSGLLGDRVTVLAFCLARVLDTRRDPSWHARALSDLQAGADRVLAVLVTPDARTGAWRDLIGGAASATPELPTLIARVDLLRGVVSGAEIDPGPLFGRLSAYLAPSPAAVRMYAPQGLELPLDDDTCIAAGADAVAAQPATAHVVVWLGYTHAFLNDVVQTHGPITFLDADWTIPNALGHPGQDFPFREEMAQVIAGDPDLGTFDDTDPPRRAVLVRADLGIRTTYRAVEDVRVALESMIGAVAATSGAPGWRPGGFHCVVADGQVRSYTLGRLRTGGKVADYDDADHYGWRFFADAFARFTPEVTAVLAQEHLPPSLREGLRLTVEAGQLDTRSVALGAAATIAEQTAVMLQAAAVEHFAIYAGVRWPDYTSATDRSWVLACFQGELVVAIQWCLEGRGSADLADTALAGVVAYHDHGPRYSFAAAYRARERLLDLCTDPFRRARARTLFEALGNPAAGRELLAGALKATELLSARWRRCRNAATHGNPTQLETVASVRDYSRYTAGRALHISLAARAEQCPAADVLRQEEADYDHLLARLIDGTSIADQWSEPPDN